MHFPYFICCIAILIEQLLLFDLKVLEFKLKESLKLYENTKIEANFELLKTNIDELCSFIIKKENHLAFFQTAENEDIRAYVISIRDLSTKILGIIEKEEARKILEDANSCFQYGEELKLTVKQEIHDYKITSQDHILFVGSGSMPITAFTIAKETGAEITCVDIDKEALDLSKKVAIKLGFPNIIFENELFSLSLDKYSHIIIASLVPLKCEILENIRKTIPVTTKLILRYGNELKELFNYPIYQKEIKTFIKTVIRDRDFIYDTLLLEKETNYGK